MQISEAADTLTATIHRVLADMERDPRMVTEAGRRITARLAAAAANLCANPDNCRVCDVQCRTDGLVPRY
jgi:hypothetical protein